MQIQYGCKLMIAFYNYVNGVEKHKEKKQTSIRNASKKKLMSDGLKPPIDHVGSGSTHTMQTIMDFFLSRKLD